MKKIFVLLCFLVLNNMFSQTVFSPSGEIHLEFKLSEKGAPTYTVTYKDNKTIQESKLGIVLKNDTPLTQQFQIVEVQTLPYSEKWTPVLGKKKSILNEYNEMMVELEQIATERKLNLYFRAYNEGVAFRYEFPEQSKLDHFIIKDEITEFNLTENYKAFWIPGDYDSNEYVYTESLLSEIDTEKLNYDNGIGAKGRPEKYTVQSPLQLKSAKGIYVNIF